MLYATYPHCVLITNLTLSPLLTMLLDSEAAFTSAPIKAARSRADSGSTAAK